MIIGFYDLLYSNEMKDIGCILTLGKLQMNCLILEPMLFDMFTDFLNV